MSSNTEMDLLNRAVMAREQQVRELRTANEQLVRQADALEAIAAALTTDYDETAGSYLPADVEGGDDA
jgi:hypothetical protein